MTISEPTGPAVVTRRPVPRVPLTERVADELVTLMRERDMRPGDPLPATADLADYFGVSIPVVREAVSSLAALGMVHRQQGRETVVALPDSRHLTRVFQYLLDHTEVDHHAVQEFREVVEVGNAALAARRATKFDRSSLTEALDRMRAATTEDQLHDADVHLHARIAAAAGNDLASITLGALAPILRRLRTRAWQGWVASGHGLEPIVEAHAQIIEAICAGDEERAAASMREHLTQAREGLEHPEAD